MFKKIPFEFASILTQRFEAEETTVGLLDPKHSVSQAIDILSQHQQYYDLIQLLAHGLPVREAIWWASLCLELRNSDWDPLQKTAITAAKSWATEPDETRRRFCEQKANQAGLSSAPGWLCQAVFWSGSGSIIAPDQPAVLPEANLYAKAVAGAINMAAALPEWDNSQIYYQRVITLGLDIAKGGNGGNPAN